MLTLIDILTFVKIADLRSVTQAARVLGMPKSSVSRNLGRLEQAVGAPLVLRGSRQLSLTDTGRVFYNHAQRILEEVDEAHSAVGQLHGTARGHLRVAAPVTSGQQLLAPLLPEFLSLYPKLTLNLELTSRQADPLTEDVDVVIQIGDLSDSQLVARRLGTFRLSLYGSAEYLARHGEPRTVSDLSSHVVLDIFEGPHAWTLYGPGGSTAVGITPRLSINDPSAIRTVALGGTGLAWLPHFLCANDLASGKLVHVLPQWHRGQRDVHALFPPPRTLTPRVRVFIDFLVEKFAQKGQLHY
ncbi:LysR family transcriptional regulator [Pusillimonas noertemannii]|uniref:LysR family transcriptional regulator n=1 Tax=Pusillimonas noertemannii TaxID=305977 RepID=A0A2U1CJT6_9BURK|nr:LysR family transcriptional regulator [Pusillimonas noertemannii]NYT69824.1 LysR family transcriptional regulator [Pusillimonas noertemannii]PVY61252.1 LysR family transcriptional regulator [Pusillimonas noertemannii]TFL09125.1 LysR family transcriptional regulator [Pusillimonas noertemannii]